MAESICTDFHGPLQGSAENAALLMQKLESSANEFWQFVAECKPLSLQFDPKKKDIPLQALMDMRANYRNAFTVAMMLSKFQFDWSKRNGSFLRDLEGLRGYLDRSAMRYGLCHLPDELLREILLYVAQGLKCTVQLTRVCRRFRSVIISCRVFWKDFRLTSSWTPEQVNSLAERSKFQDLRVSIFPVDRGCAILTETVKTIFGFHENIADLHIGDVNAEQVGKIQRYLKRRAMPKLRRLELLRIYNAGTEFKGFCEMPSLGSLRSDFIPHVSLARPLFRCNLALTKPHLLDVLEFLASSSKLEELLLQIEGYEPSEHDKIESYKPVSLPILRTMTLRAYIPRHIVRIIMERIHTPALRDLTLAPCSLDYPVYKTFLETAQSRPSVRRLEIVMYERSYNSSLDLRLIPSHIEYLAFNGLWNGGWIISPESHQAQRLEWIKFERLSDLNGSAVLSCRDAFLRSRRDKVLFEFENCRGFLQDGRRGRFRNGVYKLNEVDTALVR